MQRPHKPRWWALYLLVPLLAGLFYLESRLALSLVGHQLVQIVTILLVFGLAYWWTVASGAGVERHHARRQPDENGDPQDGQAV